MTIRELVQEILTFCELDDTVNFFDTGHDEYKEVSVKRLGNSAYFYLRNKEKSDLTKREDFFRD